VVAAFVVAVGACTAYSEDTPHGAPPDSSGGTGDAPSTGGSSGKPSGGKGGSLMLDPTDPTHQGGCDSGSAECPVPDPEDEPFCSDGHQDPGEACDDGNIESGDGCTATCAQIEGDFACPTPGEACVSSVKCGDKKVGGGEQCDDGQATPKAGDGCDASCQLEMGWVCPVVGEPCVAALCGDNLIAGTEQCEDGNMMPVGGDGCSAMCTREEGWVCDKVGEPCRKTVCNDGKKEGDEPCDDGNQLVGDGCTPLCQVEPKCPATGGACGSVCGDGLILPTDAEECDDGNSIDGDGCSATCKKEAGYECKLVQGALPTTLQLPFVFRDFVSLPTATSTMTRHPDFNDGCRGQLVEGVVKPVLDADGKPANSNKCDLPVSCTIDVDSTDSGDYCLRRAGCGANFAEPTDWNLGCVGLTHANHPISATYPGDPFNYWYRDTPGLNITKVQTVTLTRNNQGVYTYAPNEGLWPFDNQGWELSGDDREFSIGNNPPLHNYGFTTEVRHYFQFQGGETLKFSGDDDVWVFVNGHLALDLGGKHGRFDATLVLNANGTATCANCITTSATGTSFNVGIEVGKVYEIALFHAERQTAASNFTLSLTGFVKQKSECTSVCGDGVVTPDEECDAGKDNGPEAYNGCTTKCKRGAYCGDGQVDAPDEDCDDGLNISEYLGCAPGCKKGPSCGDGEVQAQHDEECDDGVLAGEYGGCAAGCVLGPRCGDGVVQKDGGESCDDGNRTNLDGCSANCKVEKPK
jgi:fibro-slime domain-containing protein